jgi:hypothetical protein
MDENSSKVVLPLRSNIHNKLFVLHNFEDTITKPLGSDNTTIIEKANNNNLARGLKSSLTCTIYLSWASVIVIDSIKRVFLVSYILNSEV